MGDRWVIVGRDDLNSQIVTSVVTVSHLRMEVYFRHLPRAPLPRQQRASLQQHEIPSAWSSEGVWGAAAAVANVSSSCFHAQPLRLSALLWNQGCKFAHRENWINPFFSHRTDFLSSKWPPSVVVPEGLEDSTTGSVAETVASVLRGCLENMPRGESTL